MDDRLYRFLKWTAIVMAVGWVVWAAYENFVLRKQPGEYARSAASRAFADGNYEEALAQYEQALRENPGLTSAMWGRAETLITLGQENEAVRAYDDLIIIEPDNAVYYANRGIALDRLGKFTAALASYEKALTLDNEVGSGPNWLVRFLRNQPEKPPGIAERAQYLRAQLALPAEERVLTVPEIDEQQRPYKQ
jgi:tetratricopeptide (TPR) repeat protein